MLLPLLALLLPPQSSPDGAPPSAEPPTWRLVEVELESSDGRADLGRATALASLGLDVVAIGQDGAGVQVVATGADLARIEALGLPHAVLDDDLAATYAARLAAEDPAQAAGLAEGGPGSWLSPPFGQGSMGGYYTFAEIVSVMQQIEGAYPGIVSMSSVGKTLEGRDVWALTISDNPGVDEGEPAVRVDAMHHCREPMSMQAALWFALDLVEGHGSDPLATYLVDERETWILPVVNPDGYVYNESIAPGGGGLWRKNRRPNVDGSTGVDLNRNYTFQWGYDNLGSSPTPSSETYRGTGPASEPETQVMEALLAARTFSTSLSIHTYGHLWITPLAYDLLYPANYAEYQEVGGNATSENGYALGPGWEILYVVNGDTTDHDHGVHGALAFSPELGTDGDGFWPPSSRILPLAELNLSGQQDTALAAGAWARLDSTAQLDEGDGDGWPEAGETVGFELTVRNAGRQATATTVEARLATTSAFASVVDGQHDFGVLASFAQADNAGAPLRLAIQPGTPIGTAIPYTLEVEYEGYVATTDGVLDVGERVPLVLDDVELDLGWGAGQPGDTASTGLWERGDPNGNTNEGIQQTPEDDATPPPGTQCFVTGNATGSASSDDVDGGFTTLVTPPFDLSEVGTAYVGYQRWYANPGQNQEDDLLVDVSNDGGQSWVPLEAVVVTQNAWTPVLFRVPSFLPQTADMRLRFVIADDPNNSVTDAAIDELRIEVVHDLPRFTIYGTPDLGTPVSLNVTGESGDGYFQTLAFGTADVPIPGVLGENLLIDPASSFLLFSGTIPSARLAQRTLAIPNDPTLTGATVYFQAAVFGPGGVFLTNRDEMTLQ